MPPTNRPHAQHSPDEDQPEPCVDDHKGDCEGDVTGNWSRSGITYSWRCDKHYGELQERLDGIQRVYPDSPIEPQWSRDDRRDGTPWDGTPWDEEEPIGGNWG